MQLPVGEVSHVRSIQESVLCADSEIVAAIASCISHSSTDSSGLVSFLDELFVSIPDSRPPCKV